MDQIDNAKKVVEIAGQLIKAAGDNPDVKEAGKELGQAALIVAKTIKNAVLPLAAINYAIDKARHYFTGEFGDDLAEKLVDVPAEQVVAPKPSIAGPALQGLAYSLEEAALKEMYLGLIASAMDAREPARAHPAFVDVIKQLSAREADLLRVVSNPSGLPVAELRLLTLPKRSWVTLRQHVLPLFDGTTRKPTEVQGLQAIVDNWIRLGLVTVTYGIGLISPDADLYAWVVERQEYKHCKEIALDPTQQEVTFERGVLKCTAFGEAFLRAVGLRASPNDSIVSAP